jgi:hypothetical protein
MLSMKPQVGGLAEDRGNPWIDHWPRPPECISWIQDRAELSPPPSADKRSITWRKRSRSPLAESHSIDIGFMLEPSHNRPMMPRRKIQAYGAAIEHGGADPSTGVPLSHTIHSAYSGFVHDASSQIIESRPLQMTCASPSTRLRKWV